MSRIALSADRRFHRAQVKPSRRRGAWRVIAVGVIKYAVLLAVAVFAGTRTTDFLSTAALLQIDRIEPSGNQRISSEAIREILGGLRGENILFADLDAWRARLMESPWIREASFKRSLPSTIDIVVQERAPIAIGRMGGRLYLVDERGSSIDEYGPQYSSLDLPIVDGFSGKSEDRKVDDARGALAARLIMALRQKPAIANRLSQVDVSEVHNVTILLSDDPTELRVGDDHFLARVESYLSLSSALRARVPEIDYVDLRFDGRVYVRPVGKTPRGSAPGAGRARVSRVTDAVQR
jgi:cell division protein FtsQ